MNILLCDEEGINEIVKSYKNGKIIAFPTDTVYGIGCDPFNKDSIARIYELKKRNEPLKLTIDTDIQFIIREELIKEDEKTEQNIIDDNKNNKI